MTTSSRLNSNDALCLPAASVTSKELSLPRGKASWIYLTANGNKADLKQLFFAVSFAHLAVLKGRAFFQMLNNKSHCEHEEHDGQQDVFV